MTSINLATRTAARERLENDHYDVLVVGGGITGAGVALDAATRGLKVALLERVDLAAGTSRWSSKLVHGGLRYLAKADFPVAWESAVERRAVMTRIAPHLTRPIANLVPLDDTTKPLMGVISEAGMRIADAMRFASLTRNRLLPPPQRVAARTARTMVPGLKADGLRGGIVYWDGQLEDDARLVIAIARTAAAYGADIITHCSASDLTENSLTWTDEFGGTGTAHGLVINATGVWADQHEPALTITPSRGSHLVVPAAALGYPRAIFTAPVPGHFGRFVFAIPHPDGQVHIGLTDEPAPGVDGLAPEVPLADEEFLLATINRVLERPLSSSEIIGKYAGLRPLVSSEATKTADISRRHLLLAEPGRPITIAGGKLTTYRRMAQDAVDAACNRLGTTRTCRTAELPLVGAASRRQIRHLAAPESLRRRYGTEATRVAELAEAYPDLAGPVAEGCTTLGEELVFGVRHEGALTVDDLIQRRTRVSFVEEHVLAATEFAERVLARLVPEAAALSR